MTNTRPTTDSSDGIVRYMQIDLPRLLMWIRIKWRWVAAAALAGALLAIAYTMVADPRYTVTTELLLDPAGLRVMQDDLYGSREQRDTQLLAAEGMLRTLLSRNVLSRVIAQLDLTEDPEFVPQPSLIRRLIPIPAGESHPENIALAALSKKATARRDEDSYVITLSVSTTDAAKSVHLSEAIVEQFRAEMGAAETEGATRTADALATRLSELKQEVNAAEEAVETFRRENGLRASQGELMSSRSMSQVDNQLQTARETLIAAEARHRELASHGVDSTAIQSPTLSSLRTQYAETKQRADAQQLVYGPRHPQLQASQRELRSLQDEIDAEMARLTRAAENEVNQARARVDALQSQSGTISMEVFDDNESQIRLRDLLRDAAAKSTIYEAFLARARAATERQNLDSTNIRVISPPVQPSARSWPPGKATAGVFGAGAGTVLGILAAMAFGIYADTRPASPKSEGNGSKPVYRRPAHGEQSERYSSAAPGYGKPDAASPRYRTADKTRKPPSQGRVPPQPNTSLLSIGQAPGRTQTRKSLLR